MRDVQSQITARGLVDAPDELEGHGERLALQLVGVAADTVHDLRRLGRVEVAHVLAVAMQSEVEPYTGGAQDTAMGPSGTPAGRCCGQAPYLSQDGLEDLGLEVQREVPLDHVLRHPGERLREELHLGSSTQFSPL
jgi:hypothetical protein